MTILVEGPRSIWLGGQAHLVEDARELAWAENYVRSSPDLKWILGRYVEAETPNGNGHIFPVEDLPAAQLTVVNKPLNLLHYPQRIVGHYVATDMQYPISGESVDGATSPFVEALSCFYSYYFPEELREVEKAHAEGALYYSMEAIPASLTCEASSCGEMFKYAGRQSATYCAHLNEPGARKRLNQPTFMGGALIYPPVKPGWRRADVTQISELMHQHADEAEMVYDQLATDLPHLDARSWEYMMAQIVAIAEEDDAWQALDRDFSSKKRRDLAKSGKALPDGSFPIENKGDLKNAIKAVGRASSASAAKAHIKRRAKALGAEDLIPDGWE